MPVTPELVHLTAADTYGAIIADLDLPWLQARRRLRGTPQVWGPSKHLHPLIATPNTDHTEAKALRPPNMKPA
ncbi:MAG: hypothetical protein GY926_27245 [bacterium]|nr:hypothetical protein [bacterium]